MNRDRDYVLGTHDEEIVRLGLQHRVWRDRALRAWTAAGFRKGQTLVDVGCGPGYATLDLAEITGPGGEIVALDRSRRFLDRLNAEALTRRLENIRTIEADLDCDNLPELTADGAWIRWVLAFVKNPKQLLSRVVRLLKPGGAIVIHEYFDYATWRLAPRSELFERFVRTVMETWRAEGGEPDIGLQLARWLTDEGLEIESTRPIIDAVKRESFIWEWPATFVSIGLARLVSLGRLTQVEADEVASDFSRRAEESGTITITPGVLEIIAKRI